MKTKRILNINSKTVVIKKLSGLILLFFVLNSALGQDYITSQSGVVEENIEMKDLSSNPFNADNKIFTAGRFFEYSYTYVDSNGILCSFRKDTSENAGNWKGYAIVEANELDSNLFTGFTIRVMPDFGWFGQNPEMLEGYNQSVLEYALITASEGSSKEEQTGVIENVHNLWMHPPRQFLFKILETQAFPYVKLPVVIGSKHRWYLDVGAYWGDFRWKNWEGTVRFEHQYEVVSEQKLDLNGRAVPCFLIESQTKSTLGNSSAKFWFSEQYGFVKMEFYNLNKSVLTINLISVTE